MAAKLSSVLRAVGPETIADLLSEGPLPPEAGIKAQGIRLESTRLQAPLCFWSVYAVEISGSASSPLWVTAKTFFDDSIFTHYAQQISMHYGDRVGDLLHPQGGIVIFPHKATVVWSFPYDPALPGLAMALENSAVAPILGAAPDALRVETVRYTPEIGAMLRYLAGGETLAYGKASSQERGATAFAALSALHLIQRRHQERVRFPEPLGYLPEAKLMLQRPVPGRPLAGDRSSPRFAEAMEAAAAALVTIHTSAVPVGRPRLLEEELARLQGMLQEFPYTAPQLYLALRKLLGHIESRGSKERLSPLVPSHGDFKYDQLLWDSQGFSLIDFEYFCQAEAAFDVGYFCGYLPASSPTGWEEAAAAEDLRRRFLDAYAQAVGEIDMRRAVLYEAVALALRATSHMWTQREGWQLRASFLIDLAFERLVSPRSPSWPGAENERR